MFWLGVVTPFLVALMVSTVVAVTYGTMWLIHKAHHSCLKPLRLTPPLAADQKKTWLAGRLAMGLLAGGRVHVLELPGPHFLILARDADMRELAEPVPTPVIPNVSVAVAAAVLERHGFGERQANGAGYCACGRFCGSVDSWRRHVVELMLEAGYGVETDG